MASRLVRGHKKATVLVTSETLEQAMSEARILVQRIGYQDPRAQELKKLYGDIAGAMHSEDIDVNIEETFDDVYYPTVANKLKAAVNRIAELKGEIAPPAGAKQAPAQVPMSRAVQGAKNAAEHLSCPDCEAGGFKNQQELDGHKDKHKGRMASEKEKGALMSSRLFARKKKISDDELLDAAPEAVAGDAPVEPLPDAGASPAALEVPAAAPAPSIAPPTAGNSFANLPTQALTAIAEALTKVDEWQTNPAILGAIEQVAEELKNRPMEPAAPEGAPKMAKAPAGWEGTVKEMKKDKGIDNPFALANWMEGEGYTPHKASFMIKRGRGAWLQAKFAAATMVPPVNEDTLEKVDGQPHEVKEIGEAHSDREGVEKAEKHDSHPGTSGTDIKSPQDMEKQAGADSEISKALKLAVQLEKKLGELYLDAKPIMRANASAAIRDAVESVYDAKNKFAEATKVLNRHEMQANAEEEAQEKALDKGKKASTVPVHGLALCAAE